jgi:hypothetical protein
MRLSTLKILAVLNIGLCAAVIAPPTRGAPAVVGPGDTNVPVPVFSGGTPTMTQVGNVGGGATMNGISIQYDEEAFVSSLNPGLVTFEFVVLTDNVPSSLSVSLPGFSGFSTSVESCLPSSLPPPNVNVCGTATGVAGRSAGAGDLLTFSDVGTTPVSTPIGAFSQTNSYGIFTSAPSFTFGSLFTITDDGTSFVVQGLAPANHGPPVGAPEPGTFALLWLGLLSLLITQRRKISNWRSGLIRS